MNEAVARGLKMPLYIPSLSAVENSQMYKFLTTIEQKYNIYGKPDRLKAINNIKATACVPAYIKQFEQKYEALHQWSIDYPEQFWVEIWDLANFKDTSKGSVVKTVGRDMIDTNFFPDGYLNFAQQLMKIYNDEIAIQCWCEDVHKFEVTYRQLYHRVSTFAQALQNAGVTKGDKVCAVVPNTVHAIVGMLATTSLGGVWSSASPDFGVNGLLDRFDQIRPKVLISTDYYYYKGKRIDCLRKARIVASKMQSKPLLVIAPYNDLENDTSIAVEGAISLSDFTKGYTPAKIEYAQMNFNDPAFILFSSGTTGLPKCIVHRVGLVLQFVKEHKLQCDIRPGDRVFYATTCGWMMWNWLVGSLASEASLCLYEGSPFHPTNTIIFDFLESTGVNFFGTSAKYLQTISKFGINVKKHNRIPNVRIATATGSPLLHEHHQYFYDAIKSGIPMGSISGGTDICSVFVGLNPMLAMWCGEIQSAHLGMAMNVYNEEGKSVSQIKGDLVCNRPFPTQPICFLNDAGKQKFHKAYFNVFPNVWTHGDFAERTINYGWVIYGRTDAVLNPGGVRIGTSEIYRVVEDEEFVTAAAAVGRSTGDGDLEVILFVIMRDGRQLTPEHIATLKRQIKTKASPRHVPTHIYAVSDLPYTKTGKLAELAIRAVINNQPVKNTTALENPQSLENFIPYRIIIKPKL